MTALGPCEVCAILRGDRRPKPVAWCGLCRAWLCEACRQDWVARAQAALLRKLGVTANA